MTSEPTARDAAAILADSRRRYLLYCLYLYSGPMKLADIADRITIWEDDADDTDYLRERLHVYNDLYHDHLPILQDAGIVDYSQTEDMVELEPRGERLERTVEQRYWPDIIEVIRTGPESSDARA